MLVSRVTSQGDQADDDRWGVLVFLRDDCVTSYNRRGCLETFAEQGNAFIAEMLHVVFCSDSEDTGQKCDEGGEVSVGREVVKEA